MALRVYDYRTDIRNVLVTPEIRSRFITIDVGAISGGPRTGRGHSHDLGHEIFLMLQGCAEFEVEGERQVCGPGQLVVALADEKHTIRNVGDEQVIMYLSVTPHIQPTHTRWMEEGNKAAPGFSPSTAYDVPPDRSTSSEELADRHLAAAEALAERVAAAKDVQQDQIAAFKRALAEGDSAAALEARDAMWEALYPTFKQVYALADVWNDFTYRTADSEF
jgi:mannose-6-phosphate isomerase-like protein (cupin superfamily)